MNKMLISHVQSPLGLLQIESKDGCISSLKFTDPNDSFVPATATSTVIETCKKELNEYFEGLRKTFSVDIKPEGTAFENSVWNELRKIPYGKTISYEELARRLGDLKKIRAAARANGKNPLPILIPCHRVIGKDGDLVGFSGGLDKKKWLLSHEGSIAKQFSIF